MEDKDKDNDKPCCPKFDPTLWEGKTHKWQDKLFIVDSIPEFMHMPWPPSINKLMTKMWDQAQKADAAPAEKDFLCLSYDPSPWKCEYYLLVTKEVPGAKNVKLSGEFYTKVFDGQYNEVPKWIKVMDKAIADQNRVVEKYYFYYTTCPKCAKLYGHNYVVAFAQLKNV